MVMIGDGGTARDGLSIFEFNPESGVDMLAYLWKSKLFLLPHPVAFSYCRVRAADYTDLVLRLYGDGVEMFEHTVTNGDPFRLPMLNAYNVGEVEVLGTSRVRTVELTESIEELA